MGASDSTPWCCFHHCDLLAPSLTFFILAVILLGQLGLVLYRAWDKFNADLHLLCVWVVVCREGWELDQYPSETISTPSRDVHLCSLTGLPNLHGSGYLLVWNFSGIFFSHVCTSIAQGTEIYCYPSTANMMYQHKGYPTCPCTPMHTSYSSIALDKTMKNAKNLLL